MTLDLGLISLSILHNLVALVDKLPTAFASRCLHHHDVVVLAARLLGTRPWRKRASGGVEMVVEDGQWRRVEGDEVLFVGKHEAQV
jgi:hypothetical protein